MPLTSPDGYLDFTNAVPRAVKMVATSNVGIGTSSPIYALDVHGTSNTGPLTVSSLTLANGAIEGDLNISGNLVYTSNTTTIVNSNVVVEYTGPHGRDPKEVPLKKYPEIVFAEGKFDANDSTNTYVQAGYTVTASSQSSGAEVWRLFDDGYGAGSYWNQENVNKYPSPAYTYSPPSNSQSLGGTSGEWFKLELPQKIIVNKIEINAGNNVNYAPLEFKIFGSNNDTDWTVVKDVNGLTTSSYSSVAPFITMIESVSSVAYKYYAIVFTRLYAATQVSLHEFKFYGYEEDPPAGDTSIDTTFTSIMNTPQTTGANVYIDGNLGSAFTNRVTGPLTATGTSTTYDSTGKYWELNGELTSNITVEANTFLEGDQPHAVSVWFNSSNLEANTANTCVFSISDQEKLDSVNLDLQSNTWHNLTYSYQGEGGSRVTYLDGRKVSEDQAEDTFGEYPPFAMTGYSQGGYVVSASNPDGGTEFPWEYYDNDNSTIKTFGPYYGNSGSYDRNPPTNHGGNVLSGDTVPNGEWHKIKMPHKLILGSIGIRPRNHSNLGEPVNWYLYGSNDDLNWTMLYKKTDSSVPDDALETQYSVNATTGFSYFLIVMTKSAGYVYLNVSEFNWYGHRENDLVRLPDPTNVLKYPHVALTGPAQRGYVVTASDTHNTIITNNGGPWQAFDGTITQVTTEGWVSPNSRYSNDAAGSTAVNGVANSFNGRDGEWLNIKLPHKITLSSFETFVRIDRDHEHPTSGYLYASNDGFATFQEIYSFTDVAVPGEVNGKVTHMIPSSHLNVNLIPYNEYRIQATKLEGAAGLVSIAELKLYGTGVDSIPIQIGGGNIDKVANFRVYDKFVEEDQALEIWDAQKDEFGRAKSSMTLHKGRLGIGTEEPEGRLAVADEPDPDAYGLQRIPPKPASGYDTYIDGYGMFQVSSSNAAGGTAAAYWAFDHDIDRNNHSWRNDGSPYTSGTWNSTQTASTTENSNTHVGHWIQLYTPVKYSLKSHKVSARAVATHRQPYSAVVLGSTDGSTWKLLDTWTTTDVNRVKRSITIDNTTLYNYFRLVVKALENNGDAVRADLGEWELYGIREQLPPKQSVLHDGQLTLTKNLNVPRIGPVFGEYPTPRRNDLLLEYNTALSIHSGDHVIDTSGNSNDGNFNGDATYSEGNRAFEFDGSGDWIYPDSAIVNPAGAWPHSFSIWINTRVNNIGTFFSLGVESSHQSSTVIINSSSVIKWFFYSNDMNFNLPNGLTIDGSGSTWYHFAGIYNGGSDSTSRRMWMNGQELTVANPSTTFLSLNIATNTSLRIGIRKNGSHAFNGFISNFRLYNCVLTPNEIFTLYKQGRVPPVHHLQLIDSTMTIGPHSRDPGAHLDVAGHIRAGSQTIHTFTGQHRCFPDEPVEKGLIVSAKKNRFVKLNGFATGQEAITIDESLPIVSLSNVAEDKACFGVVSSIEKPTPKRTQVTNGIISDSKKERGDNRAIVNSVGEGAIWVVNTGGPLESGDYITTSNVAGYGQKQEDDVLHNYTVAKITMDCDFTGSNVAVQTIKREETGLRTITEDVWNTLVDYDRSSNTETQYSNTLDPEAYSGQSGYTPREVTTIVDYTDGSNLISIAEWSNLESNIQNTYQSNTFTEIADYTKFISLDEWSNLTSNVQNTYSEAEITTYYQIQRGENVLDENGQLQWEDKTGATEAPYERRFLDASGAQTDEANAVHIAAFVGCTYHCG